MAQLKVFVGSSSGAQKSAEWVKKILSGVGGVEVRGWWEAFRVGRTNIETLLKELSWADASIFIFSEDDHLTQRGDAAWAPRDNVVFEYGMFVAAQGMENAALAKLGNPAIPSDLGGVINIGLEKIDDEDSFIEENREAVRGWIEAVKETHEDFPTVPPVTQIKHEHLKAFGASIVASTEKAVRHLIHHAYMPQLEADYWDSLIRDEIGKLGSGDALWAICGAKNYNLKDVCRYLNENIELARGGVFVHRLYVAPDGEFEDSELEVIQTHLEWAEKLGDRFKVGVLVGEEDCKKLLELKLPHRFGMVLTRRGDSSWKSHIHYPDYPHKDRQVGWVFGEDAIVLKLRMLFEDIARKAERDGVPPGVTKAMEERLTEPGYVRKELLWRCSDRKRPV